MLEVSSVAAEVRLGIDFASSSLYQRNKALVMELSTPPAGANDLYFASQYSQSAWGQFKSCLWKQWWTYWRSPDYNLVSALMIGAIFWQVSTKRDTTTDLTMIIGAMYAAVLLVGIANCSTVQPLVATERTVFYHERAAGMYSALPYALAQVRDYCTLSLHFENSQVVDLVLLDLPSGMDSLRLILSQYGDIEDTIKAPGIVPDPSVKSYIKDQYGYKSNFMGPIARVLVGFAAFFAFMFAYCIKTLNFQTR
ncbi:hypothetical protein V6N11_045861 [Hibiscus sabdariffa]|uniref:ABC-2 type transporter transmembrane domain-containing protein n=1 Tax=Hibiscus sabdariffa TaxID=183260 RepID=A0ABR2Q280_9ROSI